MSDTPDVVTRRSIPVPGGTCMTRMGRGAIDVLGAALSGSVNTARRALLAYEEGTGEELVELVRRELTNAGFVPRLCAVPEGPAGAAKVSRPEFRPTPKESVSSDPAPF